MRSSLGLVAVFVLAISGAVALALVQSIYAPQSKGNSEVAGASSRDLYIADELGSPFGYAPDLPLGEVQFLTVKGLVVENESQYSSTITPDGTSFKVNSGMQPGDSYAVFVSLNNSSMVHQSAELTVEAPQSVTIQVQASPGSAAAPEVSRVGRNHWTIIHPGETQPGGPFDLSISVYSSKFLSLDDGGVHFELRASEYIPQRPQLAGLVY